jgi:hypothetical protein
VADEIHLGEVLTVGQRHQIYVALPYEHPFVKRGEPIVGLHHQWLYGHTAIRLAERFLTYVIRAHGADGGKWHALLSGFQSPKQILSAIYSCDPDSGYYHDVHDLDGEVRDPALGDNNDGITVFDLRTLSEKRLSISYCFVSFGHRGLPELSPVDGRTYCRAYYPAEVSERRTRGRVTPQLDGKPNLAEIRVRQLERLKVPVMTLKALYELWPDTFAAGRRELPPRIILPDLGDQE